MNKTSNNNNRTIPELKEEDFTLMSVFKYLNDQNLNLKEVADRTKELYNKFIRPQELPKNEEAPTEDLNGLSIVELFYNMARKFRIQTDIINTYIREISDMVE